MCSLIVVARTVWLYAVMGCCRSVAVGVAVAQPAPRARSVAMAPVRFPAVVALRIVGGCVVTSLRILPIVVVAPTPVRPARSVATVFARFPAVLGSQIVGAFVVT